MSKLFEKDEKVADSIKNLSIHRNPNLSSDFKSDSNCCPNVLESDFEKSTIQFGRPNRPDLLSTEI